MAFVLVLLCPLVIEACLWDGDTIAMEKARFPEVLDVITGNFPRHSREFHEWRVSKATDLLKADPQAMAVYDDLAVSQHKLGNHEAAFETMKKKEGIKSGVYETYSNMGTFLIYTGNLPKAAEFIKKALSVNPDAHFGREKYQLWLIEWVSAGKPKLTEKTLPNEDLSLRPQGYAAHVLSRQPITQRAVFTEALRQDAIKGVLGMMRFADHDNPILLEALGDLLLTGQKRPNATNLAGMSFLLASQVAKDADEKKRLTDKYEVMRKMTVDAYSKKVAEELEVGLKKASEFNASVRLDELEWIRQGKNVSEEFTRKYLAPKLP
jgi:hypothetical protein